MQVNVIVVIWFCMLALCVGALVFFVLTTRGKDKEAGEYSTIQKAVDETLKANGLRRRSQIISAVIFLLLLAGLVGTGIVYLKEKRDFGNPRQLR